MRQTDLFDEATGVSEALNGGVLPELRCWVQAELMPWRLFEQGPETIAALVRKAVDDDPSVFRFTICGGVVSFHEKPSKLRPGHDVYRDLLNRGTMYRRFLQAVVDAEGITGTAELAIDLDDLADSIAEGPVFCFQKVRGARSVLIPDVDILDWDFYLDDKSNDPFAFLEKLDAAVFVGSTTGMLNIDRATVENLSHKRIRSAVYFKGHPEVQYRLPSVVQCDSIETEALIRSLGLGDDVSSWKDQFSYRYLISVDGNGATCSRVAIALKSNSVLMRYNSINDLYYFHGMKPWKHYVPVDSDIEVTEAIIFLRSATGLGMAISRDSRSFYRSHMSRIAVIGYTAELINGYMKLFGNPSHCPENRSIFLIDMFAHVKNQGDTWAHPNGWIETADGNWIEGIALIPGPRMASGDLYYRTTDTDGRMSDYAEAWELSGSRGLGCAITGFEIRLSGMADAHFSLHYEARFLDGTQTGPMPAGSLCRSSGWAPLTAVRLIVTPRRDADGEAAGI